MRICGISDTHSYHRDIEIPEADILICAGDITWRGELDIISDFTLWLKDIPIKHKIVILGNHELGTQKGYKREPAIDMIRSAGAHYLEDSDIVIDGVKFYGSPASPFFHAWEFNYQRGPEIAAVWDKIHTDTNILITHGPPFGILDEAPRDFGQFENVGCSDLSERIEKLTKLKAHFFGHIHAGYGFKDINGVQYCNVSTCTERYKPTNKPIVIDI